MDQRFRLSLPTVRLMVLVLGAVFLILGLVSIYHVTTNYRVPIPVGVKFGPLAVNGTITVEAVVAGSVAEAAGLRAGDSVKASSYANRRFTRFAGERIDFTVLQANGRSRTVSMVLLPLPPKDDVTYRAAIRTLDIFVSLLAVLTALMILLRGQLTRSNISIGLSLICLGYTAYILPLTAIASSGVLTWLAAFDHARFFISEITMVLFAKFLFEEKIGILPRSLTVMTRTTLALITAAALSNISHVLFGASWFLPDPDPVFTAVGLLAGIVTFVLLLTCWSRSVQPERARVAMLAASVGLLPICTMLITFSWFSWKLYAAGELLTVVFQLTFGYAVIRHRVVDLGFAINRALVFTVISTALLIVFGITEFAVDKLLHFEGRQKNVIFDAAVALGIILCFHRIQHWVSHRIDHTFFHHWYAAAKALRTFIERAPHIVSMGALQENYLAEMKKFCGASDVVQYMRGTDLAYHRTHGESGLPAVIPADSRVTVALRHGRAAVDLGTEDFKIAGDFAFPMLLRGAVNGIIVFLPKADGSSYRPDEIQLLAECVRSYAVDLESLRVEELERKMAAMAESKARLEGLVEVLRPGAGVVAVA